MMSDPILQVHSLKKSFGSSRNRINAVNGVSFEIHEGKTLGLVGQSGCGKSTIGRMLVGLHQPDEGSMIFRGTELTGLSKKERRKIAPRMQMIFQSPYASLNPGLTVEDIVLDAVRYHGLIPPETAEAERAAQILDMVELPRKLLRHYPHELSGGQCQRVGIARALALNPELLICDEITSALDLNVQAQILNLLLDLQQQLSLTVLFISHDIGVVRHMSDHIAVMHQGIIVETGPCERICQQPMHPYTQLLLRSSLGFSAPGSF